MAEFLNKIAEDYINNEGNLISILQNLQNEYGYLPEDAIEYLSDKIGIPSSKFYGIATFYAQFHLKPRGKNIITTCCGTACHVKGSDELISLVRDEFDIANDEDTSKDGLCTVEKVACVGACSIAPVVVINKKTHGKVKRYTLMKEIKSIKEDKDAEKS